MKKFLFNSSLFFIVIALIDILFGIACKYMNDHSKGGGVKNRYYVCKESNEDILVFGSSRAKHHYVPSIIEDSLNMTCYNTGEDGNGIIYCYGMLKMILQRYSPEVILYDISDYDLFADDNMKYLDLLKPYYNESGIDSLFWSVEPKTRIMMCSNLYRYNTSFLRIFGNFIYPIVYGSKGYSPLYKIMDYEPVIKDYEQMPVDTLKLFYFNKFVETSKRHNIKLICCISPLYKAPVINRYEPLKNICENNDILFLDFNTDTVLINNRNLYQDRAHLNEDGAQIYTSKLVEELKKSE